jgi:hypothetical protein
MLSSYFFKGLVEFSSEFVQTWTFVSLEIFYDSFNIIAFIDLFMLCLSSWFYLLSYIVLETYSILSDFYFIVKYFWNILNDFLDFSDICCKIPLFNLIFINLSLLSFFLLGWLRACKYWISFQRTKSLVNLSFFLVLSVFGT